jgi:hypothetical protein
LHCLEFSPLNYEWMGKNLKLLPLNFLGGVITSL